MAFHVEELSIQLIEALAPLMPRIKQRDKSLEDQLRRAASSIGLNCAEAAFSDPGNRRARLFTAAGSAGETRHALRQAVAWRLVAASDAKLALKLVGAHPPPPRSGVWPMILNAQTGEMALLDTCL